MTAPLTQRLDDLIGRLVARRKAMNLTQLMLADRLGIKDSQVSNWEIGIKSPRLASIMRWADALEMDVSVTPRDDEKKEIGRHAPR